MSDLKRIPVKYIRDFIKKHYKARDCCYICGSTEKLELHHLYSVAELFEKWCTARKLSKDEINSVDQIKELRVEFEADNKAELDNEFLFTLCKMHHERLHNIYGQQYPNAFASKVRNWIEIQKGKHKEG